LLSEPLGKVLASVGKDGTERLWDVDQHRLIGEPMTYGTGELTSVAFITDRFETVAAGVDGQMQVTSFDLSVTIAQACATANRNLSQAEWDTFVGAGQPYRDCMGNR
jgi:WD40 repeat protein